MDGLPNFPLLFERIENYFDRGQERASKAEFDAAKEAFETIRNTIYYGIPPVCGDHPRSRGAV